MPRAEQDLGQPSTRRKGKFTDQFGRKWFAEVDKRSGGTVGKMQPLGWTAPWEPDQQYFRFDEDDPTRFTIDLQGQLADRLAAHEQWGADYRDAALKRGWDPDDETKANALVSIIGPKPLPVEPIVAAVQGNRWILGFTDVVDERVAKFLPRKQSKLAVALESYDFGEPDEDLERRLDLEEAVDPDATGGKRVPAKRKAKAGV